MAAFTDAATGHVWVYLLKNKGLMVSILPEFIAFLEQQYPQHSLRTLRTDNGGEFVNHAISKTLSARGIKHELTAPYTSAQNGVAERRNRTILDDVRTLLADSNLPLSLWGIAAKHAVYVRNRIPRGNDMSPTLALTGNAPRIDHLRVFGSLAVVLTTPIERTGGKISVRGKETIFVGHAGESNVLVYDPFPEDCRSSMLPESLNM